MAAATSRPAAVGSTEWLLDERMLADSFVDQEVEEFKFSAHNDMEWLNEHMVDIFNRNHFDFAEAFKTPGKLRGKTPRTARKRNGAETRAPLTDVFTSNPNNAPATSYKSPFLKKLAPFRVAEDRDESHVAEQNGSTRLSFGPGKENNDSGYHGRTEDEMEVDRYRQTASGQGMIKPRYVLSPKRNRGQHISRVETLGKPSEREESLDTFVSAEEEVAIERIDRSVTPGEKVTNTRKAHNMSEAGSPPPEAIRPQGLSARPSTQYTVSASTAAALDDAFDLVEQQTAAHQVHDDSSSSEDSSTQRPVLRKKSSLTFASLPAREPLTTKKSMGARPSRTSHVDQSRGAAPSRESYLDQNIYTKPKIDAVPVQSNHVDDFAKSQDDGQRERNDLSEAARLHSKTSTQRLQERLAMLGKTSAPRVSKSNPSNAEVRAFTNDEVEAEAPPGDRLNNDENDESWIGPIQGDKSKRTERPSDRLPDGLAATQMSLPARRRSSRQTTAEGTAEKDVHSYPILPKWSNGESSAVVPSNEIDVPTYPRLPAETRDTIMPSPISRHDGPLSASKAKLFSVIKSAKGIFASSASASAQAKMNTSSPRPKAAMLQASAKEDPKDGPIEAEHHAAPVTSTHGLPDSNKELPKVPRRASDRLKAVPTSEIIDVVTSAESNVRVDAIETDDIAQTSTAYHQASSPTLNVSKDKGSAEVSAPPLVSSSNADAPYGRKTGEPRRPARIAKDPAPKARPAPVPIRLYPRQPMSGFVAPSRSAMSVSQPQDSYGAVAALKQPALTKKASNSSLQTVSSTQSFKTAATAASSRPKALEAAARKKEQDEKEAQRKAEQKREMDRRRAAKAEEERRAAEDQKAAERRANETKQQAQKQAAEQRKADALRRNEQLRIQGAAVQRQQVEDLSTAAQNERPNMVQHLRSDVPPPRPMSRMASNQDYPRPPLPHVNPAKPPKRQFDADGEEERIFKPQLSRAAQAEQHLSKRRRTSEDSFAEVISRPTMAPPVRPSMMKKGQELNARQPNALPGPGPNHAGPSHAGPSQAIPSMMKSVVNTQHQMQHPSQYPRTPHMSDLAKFSTAKIPFAETTSSAHQSTYPQQQQQRMQHPLKTPGTASTHKSSPQYPNGDSIELPEIATDSEDSDDDDFQPPDWANSPALRELLKQQQLVDPLRVFGPIAPLMMEEVFKGNKERQAKFRKRTSSANWNGPDRLTEDERKKDREARERLERDGAWTYGTNT